MHFEDLENMNKIRCESHFHALSHWSPTDWGCAMAGECGEACNKLKKLRRLEGSMFCKQGETDVEKLTDEVMEELADMVVYADLLSQRLGRSLGEAIKMKFNKFSNEIGSSCLI